MKISKIVALLCAVLLVGCETTSSVRIDTNPHYLDQSFAGYEAIPVESEDDVFQLDEEARKFVIRKLQGKVDPTVRMETLMREIFERTDFNLIYDGTANTVASETFRNQTANCLSLSIMTYSLARAAKLGVSFQEIKIPEYWTRREGFSMLNGHVNLRLTQTDDPERYYFDKRAMIVDFDPFSPKKRFPSQKVSRDRILAMFYNNKGADALVKEDYLRAYAYFRASLERDNVFQSTWINLGILYRITGHFDKAESTYKQALAINENNLTIMENMAVLYEMTGRVAESEEMMARVKFKRRSNPYYHYIQGEVELDEGQYNEAIAHYKRALALDSDNHEFYYGLAKSYAALGDMENSQKYLRMAKRRAGFEDQKLKYQNKIDLLTRL